MRKYKVVRGSVEYGPLVESFSVKKGKGEMNETFVAAEDAAETIHFQAEKLVTETGIPYYQAIAQLAAERPGLFSSYFRARHGEQKTVRQYQAVFKELVDVAAQERARSKGISYSAAVTELAAEKPSVFRKAGY